MEIVVRFVTKTVFPAVLSFFVAVWGFTQTFYNFSKCYGSMGEDVTRYLPQKLPAPEGEIYLIDRAKLNSADFVTATSLQGITAQTRARVYIYDSVRIKYIQGYLEGRPDITPVCFDNIWDIVDRCKADLAGSGYILYEAGNNPTINMAATACGVERWLMVEVSQAAKAEAHGLTLKRNLAAKSDGQYTESPEEIFDEYRGRLNNTFLLHQNPGNGFARDYQIAVKAPCLYVREDDEAGVAFREKVFAFTRPNSMLFGWTSNEGAYVARASKYGLNVIASDFCMNLSFMGGLPNEAALSQKNEARALQADPGKHYVAIVMSDGDNLQWFEGAFPSPGSHFQKRQATDTSYKMSWTAPPLAALMEPAVMRSVYESANENDHFVCGVSGIGYIHPSQYPAKFLNDFVNYTAYAMDKADMRVVALLEEAKTPRFIWERTSLNPSLKYFAKNEYIDGGLIQCGDRYQGLGGRIYWVGDKPFISCGLSFWYGSDEGGSAPNEWIEQIAAEINALPASIHTEKGYTYLNVHPWSTNMDNLNYLVSLLGDGVELVTAEELVTLVKDNVWH